jgi:isomerase DpgB
VVTEDVGGVSGAVMPVIYRAHLTTMQSATTELDHIMAERAASPPGPVVIDVRNAAGQELGAWPGPVSIATVNRWERALRRLEQSPDVVVVLLGERPLGAAVEMAFAADLRIAHPQLVISFAATGTWPSTLLFRMVQQVGLAPVRRMMMLGESLDGRRAATLGLVDVLATDIDAALASMIRQVATSATDPRVLRQLLLEAGSASYEDALGVHLAACDRYLRRRPAEGDANGGDQK